VVFALLLLLAPAALNVALIRHFVSNQPAYEAQKYPQAAVDFLDEKKLPGPVYNWYDWGGYLIRRLHGEYPVYIDGRADVYGDKFMYEAFNTFDGGNGWDESLNRFSIRTVLISPDVPLASLLRSNEQWQKVYEDHQAVIFTRSGMDQVVAQRKVRKAFKKHVQEANRHIRNRVQRRQQARLDTRPDSSGRLGEG
jgi:hypothetical protein